MTKADQMIAKAIIMAQVASDGGKRIHEIAKYNKKVWRQGYAVKDSFIVKAINLIRKSVGKTDLNWKYMVEDAGRSVIVYFQYKVGGTTHQISFHNFDLKVWAWCSSASKVRTQRTTWDGNYGGSRQNCKWLWENVVSH